jgi:hypothetical protein
MQLRPLQQRHQLIDLASAHPATSWGTMDVLHGMNVAIIHDHLLNTQERRQAIDYVFV